MQPDIIICLGKMLFNDEPDWILESRLKKTIEVALHYPEAPVVLTGGQSYLIKGKAGLSEAQAMKKYLLKLQPNLVKRLIIEEKSDSTIDQVIIIKKSIIVPGKYQHIGLVTDEINMPRSRTTVSNILGKGFTILPFPAEVKISGRYRTALEFMEQYLEKTLKRTRLKAIKPGDDSEWRRVNNQYKQEYLKSHNPLAFSKKP